MRCDTMQCHAETGARTPLFVAFYCTRRKAPEIGAFIRFLRSGRWPQASRTTTRSCTARGENGAGYYYYYGGGEERRQTDRQTGARVNKKKKRRQLVCRCCWGLVLPLMACRSPNLRHLHCTRTSLERIDRHRPVGHTSRSQVRSATRWRCHCALPLTAEGINRYLMMKERGEKKGSYQDHMHHLAKAKDMILWVRLLSAI